MRWGMTPSDRFDAYLDRTQADGCWRWKGKIGQDGVPRFRISKFPDRLSPASRFAWDRHHVSEPEKLKVKITRRCETASCVNPEHYDVASKYPRRVTRKTRDEINEHKRVKIVELRTLLTDLKVSSGCLTCGIKHPAFLEFHHRDPKEKSFGLGQLKVRSMSRILFEVAKCDVLCANCHRLRHWAEKQEAKAAA